MRKTKKGRLLITLGWLMILAAGGLTAYNVLEEQQAERNAAYSAGMISQLLAPVQPVEPVVQQSAQVIVQLPAMVPPETGTQTIILPETTKESMRPTEIEYPDYILNPNMNMPVMQIDGEAYIGLVEIPALGLKLPVMDEWSYPRLKKSPCRYAGSAYQNNLVISAHNYESHFGRLKELNEGSRISFTDSDGNRFLYEVVLVETLMPTDIKEMTSGEFDLTLFTCTVGGQYRVTVRCDRVDEWAV